MILTSLVYKEIMSQAENTNEHSCAIMLLRHAKLETNKQNSFNENL